MLMVSEAFIQKLFVEIERAQQTEKELFNLGGLKLFQLPKGNWQGKNLYSDL